MSAVTHRVTTNVTTNASSYQSGNFTPAAGDLLVCFFAVTGSTDANPRLTDSQGLGFTRIDTAVKNASGDGLHVFVSNRAAANSSMNVTATITGGNGSGSVIFVASVSSPTRFGSFASRQTSKQNNQALGATPAPVFGQNCVTTNPTLGAIFNATNPATVTPPTNWTEQADVGYSTPTTGAEYVSRDSGFTSTTITWGSTYGTAGCALAIEIDVTNAAVPQPQPQNLSESQRNGWVDKAKKYACVMAAVTGMMPWSIITPPEPAHGLGSGQPAIRFKVQRRFVSRMESLFWNPNTPAAAPVDPLMSWEPEVGQPVQSKKYLTEAVDSSDGQSPAGSAFNVGTATGGGGNTESINFKTPPPVALNAPYHFWSGFTPAVTPTVLLDWQTCLSQPVFPRRWNQALDATDGVASSTPDDTGIKGGWNRVQEVPVFRRRWNAALDATDGQSPSGSPPITPTVLLDWQAQQNQPQAPRRWNAALDASDGQTSPPDDSIRIIGSPQEQPQFKRKWNSALESSGGQAPLGGDYPPFVSSWGQPQSQPVQKKKVIDIATGQSPSGPPTTPSPTDWLQQLDQPSRRKPYLTAAADATDGAPSPPAVFTLEWAGQLAQPVRRVRATIHDSLTWSTFTPDDQVFAAELAQISQPTRPKYSPATYAASGASFVPFITATPDYVGVDQNQPTRARAGVVTHQYLFYNTSTAPENVTEDRWHPNWPQPFPIKRYLAAANNPAFNWSGFTPPETVFAGNWQPIYDQPFPKKKYLPTALVPSTFWNTSTQGESITEDKWHFQLPQPYPFKPYRPAAVYPSFFWNTSTQPENVTADRFAQPQSQPYPARPYRSAALHPYHFWVSTQVAPTIFADAFAQPQSQPQVRKRPQFFETVAWTPFAPEVITADKWLGSIEQPIRKKRNGAAVDSTNGVLSPNAGPETVFESVSQPYPRAATRRPQEVVFEVIVVRDISTDWFQPISQPYPSKRALATANQLAFTWNISNENEVVTEDRWHQPISQPYPYAKSLLTALQMAAVWINDTPPNPPQFTFPLLGAGSVTDVLTGRGSVTDSIHGSGQMILDVKKG